MIETEDRQVTARRVRTADREGQAGHSKEPRQTAKAGGHSREARHAGR